VAIVEACKVGLSRVLWDSSALHTSYVSQQWLDRHREALGDRIREKDTVVRLGDSKTKNVNLKKKVTLQVEALSPISSSGNKTAEIDFCVMNMPGMDEINGLPDILDHFLDIVFDIWRVAGTGEGKLKTIFT